VGRSPDGAQRSVPADPVRAAVAGPATPVRALEDRLQPASPLAGDGTWIKILDELRRRRLHEGRDWAVTIDAAVIRAHQHAAGARLPTARRHPRGGGRAHRDQHRGWGRITRNPVAGPAGRRWAAPVAGLTSKIHLAADTRCRPISRITTAGHRHDSLAFAPVMAGIQIRRRGPGRPRTRPGRALADKAYSSRAISSELRRRRIRATIPEPLGQVRNRAARGRRGGSTARVRRRRLQAAQRRRNARSTSSGATARSPPATTNATSSSAEPSTSPRSGSGSAILSHDPRDRL
jgi:Transposase DDE domain